MAYKYCPVCGARCITAFRDIWGDICGCNNCVDTLKADTVPECNKYLYLETGYKPPEITEEDIRKYPSIFELPVMWYKADKKRPNRKGEVFCFLKRNGRFKVMTLYYSTSYGIFMYNGHRIEPLYWAEINEETLLDDLITKIEIINNQLKKENNDE